MNQTGPRPRWIARLLVFTLLLFLATLVGILVSARSEALSGPAAQDGIESET